MTQTVHQTFYAEHTHDPATWASPRPAFDIAGFNAELERRAGCIGTVPRFRLRWAGESDDYVLEEGYKVAGYSYVEGGEEKFVSSLNADFEFPDGAAIVPVFENVKIFTPRWVIEENKGLFYEKAWFVEEIEPIGGEHGRIDLRSHYRRPADMDVQMAEHLSYLRRTLNDDDIRDGIARMNSLRAREKQALRDELKDDIAEETAKALTDGLPNPVHFDINHKFDIRQYANKKIEEHKI